MSRPLRVAVVGAGPAGLYAAGHLLEGPGGTFINGSLQQLVRRPVEVDVFERLPVPWGLLRHGVAPDHPDKKQLQRVFAAIAARPGFRLFANVEIGKHVQVNELAQWYDAVIYAVGAAGDAPWSVPGSQLPGVLSARELVLWYNGHPDYRDLPVDLSHPRVVIVGNGNVAMDVARILSQPVSALAGTDIADHALQALAQSRVQEVVILGRRGPAHAACNNPELEELATLADVSVQVETGEQAEGVWPPSADAVLQRKLATLQRYAASSQRTATRRIVLRFLAKPQAVLGHERVASLQWQPQCYSTDGRLQDTGTVQTLDCGLILTAIGFQGQAVPGLPFDERLGVIPQVGGRIQQAGQVLPGQYVCGWIKRGPRGILGTNKKCARETVQALIADAEAGSLPVARLTAAQVTAEIAKRQPDFCSWQDWLRVDQAERQAGQAQGRPRRKLTCWAELLAQRSA